MDAFSNTNGPTDEFGRVMNPNHNLDKYGNVSLTIPLQRNTVCPSLTKNVTFLSNPACDGERPSKFAKVGEDDFKTAVELPPPAKWHDPDTLPRVWCAWRGFVYFSQLCDFPSIYWLKSK